MAEAVQAGLQFFEKATRFFRESLIPDESYCHPRATNLSISLEGDLIYNGDQVELEPFELLDWTESATESFDEDELLEIKQTSDHQLAKVISGYGNENESAEIASQTLRELLVHGAIERAANFLREYLQRMGEKAKIPKVQRTLSGNIQPEMYLFLEKGDMNMLPQKDAHLD